MIAIAFLFVRMVWDCFKSRRRLEVENLALSGCQIEDDRFLQAGRTWAHAASVMSFQESKASLRAARYERAEIR